MSDMDVDTQEAATTPPSAASPSSAIKRRRTGANSLECCRTCRLRKVKCGGNPGNARCTNCARLDLTCSFVPDDEKSDSASRTTPSASHTEAGTLRKRAQRACTQCHAHKTKCSGDLPRCKRCEAAGLPCEYSVAKRKFTSARFPNGSADEATSPTAMPTPREESSQSPPRQLRTGYELLLVEVNTLNEEEMIMRRSFLLRHMDLFMEYFYYVPCLGYLNPDIWYKEINDMTIHTAKAAAMCSLTCFFNHPGEEGRNFGLQLAGVVDLYILSIINDFSEETFMLLSINTLFYLLHGSFAKVWNCFGMLSRLMIGMGLNWEGHSIPTDSFMHEEIIRRMVWQVFSMDRLLAGGYEEYIACRAENMTIRLPCIETAFRQNTRALTDRLSDVQQANLPALGLHGWQIRATDLRHRIQVTTRKLVMPPDGVIVEASSFMSHINQLQNELSKLHLSFPQDLKLDAASMRHYMSAPERAGYVWLHSHVGVAHIDLYRFALPGFEESVSDKISHLPPEFVRQSQRQAVAHALSVARFINGVYDDCKNQPSSTAVPLYGDYSMTHMSTQALRVLLVALQYDLFHDLAAYTTAPPWSNAKADKDELHRLIEGILKATEGWSKIFKVTKQAYDCNQAMVDDFYHTNTFVERRIRSANDARPSGCSNGTLSPSTGSEKARSEGSPGERWLSVPQPSSNGQPGSMGKFDAAYGPPGIPTFLENARSEGGLGASSPS